LTILKKILSKNLSVRKVEKIVRDFSLTEKMRDGKKHFHINRKNLAATADLKDVEDKLRKIFGTKVSCKQKKDGSGEIVIEFYSAVELERLFELFEIIDKNYN